MESELKLKQRVDKNPSTEKLNPKNGSKSRFNFTCRFDELI